MSETTPQIVRPAPSQSAPGVTPQQPISHDRAEQIYPLALVGFLILLLVYSFGNTLRFTMGHWDDPQYSHGWLIPVFSLALLWLRYDDFQPWPTPTAFERWMGVGLVGVGFLIRLVGAYVGMVTLDMWAFIPCVAGLFLLVGGWQAFRWAAPPAAFLFFMFPLPMVFSQGLLMPLQKIATIASTYVLQTIGFAAYRNSNVIFMGEGGTPLNVAEACSGLRMLTIFVALAVALVMLIKRPIWEKIILVLSAIPIALAVNVVRIVITAILSVTFGSEFAIEWFHDGPYSAWVMMVLALGMLYLEMQLLSMMVIEEKAPTALPLGLGPQLRSGKTQQA